MQMRWLFTLLLIIFSTTAAFADDRKVSFDGQDYYLVFVNEGKATSINEYIPAGQKLSNWKEMVALHIYNDIPNQSTLEFARRLGKTIKQINPQAKFAIIHNPKNNEAVIDFLTWTTSGQFITEFNIFKFRNDPKSGKLTAYQYALRSYGSLKDDFKDKVLNNRIRLVELMATQEFPEFVKKSEFKK